MGTFGDPDLLVLQLADGALGALQVLGGGGAALLHHRQLPLDDVVLLRLLRPRHLALGDSTGEGTGHLLGVWGHRAPSPSPRRVSGAHGEEMRGVWGQGGDGPEAGDKSKAWGMR